MATPSNKSPQSWAALAARARAAKSPADLDVRFSVRQAIAAQRPVVINHPPGILELLGRLSQSWGLRGALAMLTVSIGFLGWQCTDALMQIALVVDLQGILVHPL